MNLGNKHNNLTWLKNNKFKVPAFVSILESDIFNKDTLLNKTQNLSFPVAVRSSFSGEDGHDESFAGLFDSILNVKNQSELMISLQKVAQSLISDRVISYCAHQKVPRPTWGSIVVQEMIQSKISGVIFTQDPMNHKKLIISSGLGLGENLVSGLGDSEDLFFDRAKPVYHDQKILNSVLQKKLVTQALHIESLKKSAQDIEWAVDEYDQIHFLQTRQITVQVEQKNPLYFDNSNIQESFIGITKPLTFSYAKNAYRHSYNTLMKEMGFATSEIQKHDWRHQHMLGLVDGRVYYNINSWYEGLLFLPHFGRHKKDMESMMGLEESIDFIQTQKLTSYQKLIALPKMISLLLRMIFQFTFISSTVLKFDKNFNTVLKTHRQKNLQKLSLSEILNYLMDIQNHGFSMWGPPLINDFYVMLYSGKVRRALSSIQQESLYPHLLKTIDLESFKPVLLLNEIVDLVTASEKAQSEIKTESSFLQYCKNNEPIIHEKIHTYIELFGDRVLGELKLETETYRTHPDLFIQTLRVFVDASTSKKIDHKNIDIKLKFNFFKKLFFNINLKKLQNGIRNRELMRFHRTRSFGIIREIYLVIADKLVQLKCIVNAKDIFYLSMDEIADLITFQNITQDTQKLIDLRKTEYAEFEKIESKKYKNQIKMELPLGNENKFKSFMATSAVGSGSEFTGTGCFPGVLQGEICFVTNISEAKNISGKILLAERTDPGWTPLFYLAKAVIVEKGSILSHAAIVAREVGIPIVIGVPQITQKLKSGDVVTINGTTGVIKLEYSK